MQQVLKGIRHCFSKRTMKMCVCALLLSIHIIMVAPTLSTQNSGIHFAGSAHVDECLNHGTNALICFH